jgi:hypothetical protein
LGWSSPIGFGPQLNPPRVQSGVKSDVKADLPTGGGSKIIFTTSPSELPILPQRPLASARVQSFSQLERDTQLKRQTLGPDLTVTQFEDFSCCFPNWSSPPSHLMAALSLDIALTDPQSFLLPMLKRARVSSKEQLLLDDQR